MIRRLRAWNIEHGFVVTYAIWAAIALLVAAVVA